MKPRSSGARHKNSPLPYGWGLFRYNALMASVSRKISCFAACPMKRKGKASRVRWKNRCRFPAGLICASGVKAVSAKSGGRIDLTRSMSRMSLECLRCIPLAASGVVTCPPPTVRSTAARFRAAHSRGSHNPRGAFPGR